MAEYIEREAILNRLNKVHMDNRPFDAGVQFGVDHAISCVIEAPAADVATVVHGQWETVIGSNRKEYMVCTECRVQQELTSLFTYCPNCGARMDGGKA